ncbi:hypothetical protein AAU61_02955 [Desulfocarbo indianensis]|nr:hypothetical protein AAU61_02955 [Desulfocarbo indianensis]
MNRPEHDTIAALATASGPGGIAVIRISGPRAWPVGRALFRPSHADSLQPQPSVRYLLHGHVTDPESGETVDEVLCAFFKAPHTYSTEDTVEIHAHAGPAVGQRILELCLAQGCRLARPGEFTRRAYLGGRLDLTQAEAVAQLIAASSRNEARLALAGLEGGLRDELIPLRQALLQAAASVEALLDFPDEVDDISFPELAQGLGQAARKLEALLSQRQRRRVYREGAVVVLCGRPNVGKSSLFNRLLGSRRALVASRPGTTRDAIEEAALLGGVVCRLVDTAGLTESSDEVEALGVELARGRLGQADLALLVLDLSRPLTEEDRAALAATSGLPRILALNKADLPPAWQPLQALPEQARFIIVSAREGRGLDELAGAVGRAAAGPGAEPKPGEVVASARQAEALGRCLAAVRAAAGGLAGSEMQAEIISLDLAEALAALGEVDGQGAPDQVIDAVFENFCVGK